MVLLEQHAASSQTWRQLHELSSRAPPLSLRGKDGSRGRNLRQCLSWVEWSRIYILTAIKYCEEDLAAEPEQVGEPAPRSPRKQPGDHELPECLTAVLLKIRLPRQALGFPPRLTTW